MSRSFLKASTFLLCLAAAMLVLGATRRDPAQPKSASLALPPADTAPNKTVGSSTAPITLVVYSDFECPACRALYEDTLKPLMSDYIASGKVYLVHKDFPLQMHKYSHEAARYANAAAHMGKYEQVAGILFDNQQTWAADGNVVKFVSQALPPAEMKRVQAMVDSCHEGSPTTAKVKPTSLNAAAQTGGGTCQIDKSIDEDVESGKGIAVNQTPTLLIIHAGHTDRIAGVVSYPVLKAYFDQLLGH